jgi:hypothetical protein
MTNRKMTKGQTTIYKHYTQTKDRVIQTPLKTGVNSSAPEGQAVPTTLVAPVVFSVGHCVVCSSIYEF